MTANPKVSVVFPVYNVENYVFRALKSLVNQTYINLEIIVVDDKSEDRSMSIVDSIISDTDREIIIIRHDKNKGLSAARNSGIARARGEYMYFMDSDDELPDKAIELLVLGVTTHQADLAIGEVEEIGFKKKVLGKLGEQRTVLETNAEVFQSFTSGKLHVVAWNKLVKLALIRANGLYFKEGVVHEDLLWSFQLTSSTSKAVLCKENTYRYYANTQSITGTKKIRNFESYNLIFNDLKVIIKNMNIKELKMFALRYYEYQRYAVVESIFASNLDDKQKHFFFRQISSLKLESIYAVLFSHTIDVKVKIKSLVMACPYRLAERFVNALHRI